MVVGRCPGRSCGDGDEGERCKKKAKDKHETWQIVIDTKAHAVYI
jgi:hypothetical protein